MCSSVAECQSHDLKVSSSILGTCKVKVAQLGERQTEDLKAGCSIHPFDKRCRCPSGLRGWL